MNLRKEARKANLAKWKKQGPAVIQSPLQAIHEQHPDEHDAQGNFLRLDPVYAKALHAANRGNGGTVKQVARSL